MLLNQTFTRKFSFLFLLFDTNLFYNIFSEDLKQKSKYTAHFYAKLVSNPVWSLEIIQQYWNI